MVITDKFVMLNHPKTGSTFARNAVTQFFFDPVRIREMVDAEYVRRKQYTADMPQITFLHQERLRKEIRDFLLECGYSESQVGLIDQLP